MSFEERVETLKAKHRALEQAIQEHSSRPQPDDLEIAALKKQKLRIKDELADLAGN